MTRPVIYIIDDEADQVSLLSEVAELMKIPARGFTNGVAFFAQIDKVNESDILILDLHMPDMDGIEIMRRLSEVERAPTLILISGHDISVLHSAEKLGLAHQLHVFSTLVKPISTDTFQKVILQCIGKRFKTSQSGESVNEEGNTRFSTDALRKAIHYNELLLHFQPQIDLRTNHILGAEALIRWQHPEHGLVYPDIIIPLAQRSGLMSALTGWVIGNAVRQEQLWERVDSVFNLSINICATDIINLTLPEQLSQMLDNEKINPDRLSLEITESELMGELVTSLDILTRLRLRGFGLSIDDFGTGFSSLSQLHRIPFTELKIDQSFVSRMLQDDEAKAIVKTCIMLAKELNMRSIAEGVEERKQLELLKQLGCEAAQGYFIGKPAPLEKFCKQFQPPL